MTSLSTLFCSFQNSILENQKNYNSDCQNLYPILSEIVDDEKLSNLKRFEVYYNAYVWRLLDILADDYSKLYALMGHECFYEMANQYLTQHPSTFRNVRYFGQFLSHFLKTTEPYAQQPWLTEMAILEWSMYHASDAEDAPVATKETLLQIPLENFGDLQLTFHPSLEIHDFSWDVAVLWSIIERNEHVNQTTEKNQHANQSIQPILPVRQPIQQSPPTSWIVYREERQIIFRSLKKEEALAFKAMQQGATFAETCELLAEHMEEATVPGFAAGCLQQWIEDKIVSQLRINITA